MSTSYERTFRAEILKECLAAISGKLFRLNTDITEELGFEAGTLANDLLLPEYDTDEALNLVEQKLKYYQNLYKQLEKGE